MRDQRLTLALVFLTAASVSSGWAEHGFAVEIGSNETVIGRVGAGFMGLQYNGPTHLALDPDTGQLAEFPSSYAHLPARASLQQAGVETVRLFLDAPTVNPSPGVFDWADTDTAISEIEASGMAPMLVLHQRDGEWFVGDAQQPWWNLPTGRSGWIDFATAVADRYGDRAPYFEILNEPNHIHPTRDSYMGFDLSADLFLDAATAIHSSAPEAKVGGPASFGSWEPYTWAKRVLGHANGEAQLDFVSYHVYGTESAAATDQAIWDRARWYETVPQDIRAELDAVTNKPIELALTEFNASAVFQLNGELYTDPRNVDTFGGLYAALGWLYSVRGGADTAYRFGTTGGFGLIQWAPDYELRPAYHAVRLLHEVAGLAPGTELLETTLGEAVEGLEAFTIQLDGQQSTVLINTNANGTIGVDLATDSGPLNLYRYDANRHTEALTVLHQTVPQNGVASINVPARSLVVLRAAPTPGDFNNDGVVDSSDYNLWVTQFGQIGAGLSADGNQDGLVDAADYTLWRDNRSPQATLVPEPSALLLAALIITRAPRRRPAARRRP